MGIMVKYFGCFYVYFLWWLLCVFMRIYSNEWLFMCIYSNAWLFMLKASKKTDNLGYTA